eukprot:sb/3462455/
MFEIDFNMLKATEAPLEPPKKVPRLSDFPFVPQPPPDEVLLYIFSYLDSPSLSTCRFVSKTWNKLSEATLQLRKSMVVPNDENVAEFQNTIPRFPDYTNKVISKGKPSLHHLPGEMILHIFTFLEPTDLLKCGQVCKLWYNISRRSLRPFFRRVYCYNFFKKQTRPLLFLPQGWVMCSPENGIKIIESFADILEEVVLNDEPTKSIIEVLPKCTNLKSVVISPIETKDYLDLFHAFSMSLPKSLDSLILIDDFNQDMILLLSNMCNLRELTLDINRSIGNGKRLAKILKRLQLRSLNIAYNDFNRVETDFLMNLLHALSETLEQLTVRCGLEYLIDFDSLPHLGKLKCFEFANFRGPISEQYCEKVLSKMPNLIELDFNGQECFSGHEKFADCVLRCLKGNAIRKLSLCGQNEDEQSLMNVLRRYSRTLEELTIQVAPFMMENGSVPEFPNLVKCTVIWAEWLYNGPTDDLIQTLLTLIESIPNVVDLFLSDFPSLPQECLQSILKNCPRLRTLDIPEINPTSTDVFTVYRQMTRVRTLKSRGKYNVAFLGSCKSLQNLILTNHKIEDRDIALLVHCLKHLKDLNITKCRKVTGVFIELISGLKRHSPTLTIHCPNTVNVRRESIIPNAPNGCASSKGFLKTHPAKPGGSFRHFHINKTVAMATELVNMETGMLKLIRKYQKLLPEVPKVLKTALQLCAHNVFYEGALSRRYRLTNDFDVHLQLIIEIIKP